jgi:hypothetical protein
MEQMVPDGVGYVPPEPPTRQARLDAYRTVDDHLFDSTPEREGHDLEPQVVDNRSEVDRK